MDKTLNCAQYTGVIPDDLWDSIEPFIEDAARYSHGEFSAESIRERIRKGEQQVWVVSSLGTIVFSWVTEIRTQNDRRIVIVYSASGQMKYGWEFWPYMSQWMKGNQIVEAEVYCRPSMGRLLRRRGLKTRYEVLTILPDGGSG